MFYAYVLLDKVTKELLYVGSGSGRRYKSFGNSNKGMKEYIKLNGKPEYMLYPCNSKEEADLKEEELIIKFGRKDLGTGTLLNRTGGQGRKNCKLSKEEVAKREATKQQRKNHRGGRPKGYVVKKETKEKISLKNTGRINTDERKERMKEGKKERKKYIKKE
jgi:hypothetical protein